MRCILFCVLSGLKFLTKFTTEWGKWGYRSAFNFLVCAIMWQVPTSMSFHAWVWIWYMAWLLGNTNINCHSVLAKLHPIPFYRIAFLVSARFLGWMPILFSLVYQLCLAILGIWCSTIPHLPGWFCPWTFFQNIGFNTVLTDPFMSHLATGLGYSA